MIRRMIPLLLCLTLLAGCGGSSKGSAAADSASMWSYQPNSIQLRFKSDPQLNMYDGKAHALTICLYQLATPNAFNDLAQSQSGLGKTAGMRTVRPERVALRNKSSSSPTKTSCSIWTGGKAPNTWPWWPDTTTRTRPT